MNLLFYANQLCVNNFRCRLLAEDYCEAVCKTAVETRQIWNLESVKHHGITPRAVSELGRHILALSSGEELCYKLFFSLAYHLLHAVLVRDYVLPCLLWDIRSRVELDNIQHIWRLRLYFLETSDVCVDRNNDVRVWNLALYTIDKRNISNDFRVIPKDYEHTGLTGSLLNDMLVILEFKLVHLDISVFCKHVGVTLRLLHLLLQEFCFNTLDRFHLL